MRSGSFSAQTSRCRSTVRATLRAWPLGASLLVYVGLGLAGCALTAFAAAPPSLPAGSPEPLRGTPPPFSATGEGGASPLPVQPPRIVAEAGVLPTSPFAFLDRLDEFFQRTVFSLGLPNLRARIALEQAAERIAELQALEQNGKLTSAVARGLLEAHEDLLGIARRVVVQRMVRGQRADDLLRILTRTRLSTADVVDELKEELEAERELAEEDTLAPPRVAESPGDEEELDDLEDMADLLEELEEDLVDIEGDVLQEVPARGDIPREVLAFLAEQKIAKAERDLLRAQQRVEERAAHGDLLVGDIELRMSGEAFLLTARQLFAAGNFAEALSVVKDAQRRISRLKGGKISVKREALKSPEVGQRVRRIIDDLVAEGLLGVDERAAAEARALGGVSQGPSAGSVRPPERGRGESGDTDAFDDDELDELLKEIELDEDTDDGDRRSDGGDGDRESRGSSGGRGN